MDNIEEINIIVEDEAPIDVSAELENDFLRGEKGPSNVLTIGSVEKGEEAAASITGESPNQKLNLVLPKGDTGSTGDKGDKGDNGNDGYTPIKGTDYFTEEELQEIKQDILDKVNQFSVLVVQELPAENIDEHTIYFVPKTTVEQNDVYDEFIYINNSWEHIGTTEVDLSSYYNKSEVDTKLEAVEGNEVYIGNEENAPATTKIVIDEDEQGWEDEENKTVVIEFTTASTAGGDSNLIAYPSGFSRDNCYVSGVLFWREYPNNETVTTWYCLSGNYNVRLQANGIVVNMGAGTSEQYLNKPAKIFLKKYEEA